MKNILQAAGVSKSYVTGKGFSQTVLRDITLNIEEGEFAAIMGPSGSGKSTLLYSISGMDKIDSGNVFFRDVEISKLSELEMSKVRLLEMGFIFQNIYLMKNLTIMDNIMLPALRKGKESKAEIKERTLMLLKQTGIIDLAQRDITEVSGGQLQRAAICRALINNPKMVFGDEPTGALNTAAGNEVMDILINLNQQQGSSMLIVTHDYRVAARADRVIYMLDGQIMSEKSLGKFDGKLDHRESELSMWLQAKGI